MREQLELLGRPDARQAVAGTRPPVQVAALFAGIAGVECGLAAAGHETKFFCEIDPAAQAVLAAHFPSIPIVPDVRDVDRLDAIGLVAAGFPCQDLSQAGKTAGINGPKSGLVGEVLRLLRTHDPSWLLLENVPFMLALDRGRAMLHLTDWLTQLGFRWAYRVVDTRSFGLPQRRKRVLLLASRSEDPRSVLMTDDSGPPRRHVPPATAFGFYWTEGNRGLGWAVDAVPTLKAGSTIGIPSPPAVWVPATDEIGTPDIRDAERLQGFPMDWTAAALGIRGVRPGTRWRLVGNAVTVAVTEWLGRRLRETRDYDGALDPVMPRAGGWPKAAWSMGGPIHSASVSEWPTAIERPRLVDFLAFPLRPLSLRATAGFYARASKSSLRFAQGFLEAVERHQRRVSAVVA